jgi:hypothetical protein
VEEGRLTSRRVSHTLNKRNSQPVATFVPSQFQAILLTGFRGVTLCEGSRGIVLIAEKRGVYVYAGEKGKRHVGDWVNMKQDRREEDRFYQLGSGKSLSQSRLTGSSRAWKV